MTPFNERLALRGDGDVVAAWKSGLEAGRKLGLPPLKQACLSRAIMELARCAVEGGGGECVIEDLSNPQTLRAKVVIHASAPAAERARLLLNGEFRVALSSPPVKLSQMVEWSAAPGEGERTRITLTMGHPRQTGRSKRTIG